MMFGKGARKGKVFVGMSGGVDSAVSAYLLKREGYDVTGVFIKTWTPDFIECSWRDERRDAIRACAQLNIPFLDCDAEDAYKEGVADYLIEEYRKGCTPNPDVMCNREVKFGAFWEFAKERGADYIATGHYAQNVGGLLGRGADAAKDQSYFLWTLTREDLEHVLFPVGHLEKPAVREIARKAGLPVAGKKDSQGVCFLGDIDMKEFLAHYIPSAEGDVLDTDGTVIGTHPGALFFTLGERHGFTVAKKTDHDGPRYVVAKDMDANTITVSSAAMPQDTAKPVVRLERANWTVPADPAKEYQAQVRYHGERYPVRVSSGTVSFDVPVLVSSGQSVVLYDGDRCVGGGIAL